MNFTNPRIALAAALTALAVPAFAQTSSTPTPPAAGASTAVVQQHPLDRADRRFVDHAAQAGMAEVAMGRLATVRGNHAQVKSFGQRMVDEHGKANQELKALLESKGVRLPQETERAHERDANRLGKLEGAEFDREYMKHMVTDHEKDVKDFERASKEAKDPELRAWAAKTLPVLQQHLALARSTRDQVDAAKSR